MFWAWDHRAAFRHVIFEPLDSSANWLPWFLYALWVQAESEPDQIPWSFCRYPKGIKVPDRPNSKYFVDVTLAKRGSGLTRKENEEKTPEQRHRAMTCTQRAYRPNASNGYSPKVGALGDIDVSTCEKCGGDAKVMPKAFAALAGQALAETSDRCIEDPAVIDKILAHLIKKGALPPPPELQPAAGASSSSDWLV